MDDTPAQGPSARRTAPASRAKPAGGQAKAKAGGTGAVAKAARTRTGTPKAAARRSAPSAGASSPTRSGLPVGAEATVGSQEGPVPRPERGPWRGVRGRAIYSRRIQRANERWPVAARGVAGLLSRPELVLAVLGEKGPVERDGRVLNRGVQALLSLANRVDGGGGPEAGTRASDPVAMRAQLRRTTSLAMPVRTDVHAWGRLVPGPEGAPPIPVRIYRRYGSGLGIGGDGGLLPGIVYYHGGSWVTGDLDTHDATCRLLAATARCLVVAVDYRLAPEHPFPAAVDDAVAAYAWVQRHAGELGVDPQRVGVMGDSAGGNLAAVVALETRDGGGGPVDVPPPAAQGLVYPAVDARLDTDTVRSLADGFFLTSQAMEEARRLYLPHPEDWTAWRASPLLADDHRGVAPALVVTAGFDPLRDDGSNYAEALRAAGVPVEYRCYDDQVHGFMGMGILPDSLALATEVCDAMGRLLRRSAAGSPAGR